jgi:hypothetical protein
LIKHDPNGAPRAQTEAEQYEAARAQEEQAQKDAEQAAQRPSDQESMDPEGEKIMADAFDRAQDSTIGCAMDVINSDDGVISRANIEELASRLGILPEVAQQRADVAMKAYADDAARGGAKAAGTDVALAEEALQAVRSDGSGRLRDAASTHFQTGRTGQYGDLVRGYVAGLAFTDPQRVLGAEVGQGITVSQHPTGDIVVTIDGSTHRFSDAVKMGLISVTSGRR